MLIIPVEFIEDWDEINEEFITIKPMTLQLEHSLVSISKWESKWQKPFLKENLKDDELRDYIRCMTINAGVDQRVYDHLPTSQVNEILDYIRSPMTATTVHHFKQEGGAPRSSEIVTSELIYYWMIAYNIPMECQKWHLNRLMTLIEVCNVKSEAPKKIPKNELMARNAQLNAARRKALGSKG